MQTLINLMYTFFLWQWHIQKWFCVFVSISMNPFIQYLTPFFSYELMKLSGYCTKYHISNYPFFTFIYSHLLREIEAKKYPQKICVLCVILLLLFVICFPLFKLGFCNELLKIWFTQNKWRVIHPEKTVKLFCLSRLHCESPAWIREMWDRPLCSRMLVYILNGHELLSVEDRWKSWTNGTAWPSTNFN